MRHVFVTSRTHRRRENIDIENAGENRPHGKSSLTSAPDCDTMGGHAPRDAKWPQRTSTARTSKGRQGQWALVLAGGRHACAYCLRCASCISLAATQLAIKLHTVIGPAPPGTGE